MAEQYRVREKAEILNLSRFSPFIAISFVTLLCTKAAVGLHAGLEGSTPHSLLLRIKGFGFAFSNCVFRVGKGCINF